MKRLAPISFILCAATLVIVAVYHRQQLPDRIASHFDGRGVPNGWTNASSFTLFMIALGLGVPAFVVGIMYSIRFFPSRFLNVPNPAYWRQAKNYKTACDFLFTSSFWFGTAFILWQIAFFHMIVAANQASPPHLDGGQVAIITAMLLAFTSGWVVFLLLRFLKTEAD